VTQSYYEVHGMKGRTLYTDEICERLASGESLNVIYQGRHMPTRQAEHDWIATLKVLQIDSPALAQFRREAARLDILDRDPITGRAR
jgi:hypothetical protein